MSESDFDSADEYTSLMDGHVAADTANSTNAAKRKKNSPKVASSIEMDNGVPEVHIEDGSNRDRRDRGDMSPSQPSDSVNQSELDEFEEDLKYGAVHVIKLFVPVSLCMLVVVATISSIDFYTTKDPIPLVYAPFSEETSDPGTKAWQAIANALILMCVVILMTVVLISLYKYRWYKTIHGWLIMSSLLLLFMVTSLYCDELLKAINIPMDLITIAIFVWNFGVVGMVCIHWQGPLPLQQGYLIFIASLMSLIFIKKLPEWTSWTVLGAISIWDLVAVLTPNGPLRILVLTAQERNETIFPALIYSSTVMYDFTMSFTGYVTATMMTNGDPAAGDSISSPTRVQLQSQNDSISSDTEDGGFTREWMKTHADRGSRRAQEVTDNARTSSSGTAQIDSGRQMLPGMQQQMMMQEEKGVKLGLGDFIFYGVLVGKASSYGDWNTTLACFIAILIGLCLTLLLLAIFEQALPALPISITFGLIFYFATRLIIAPFSNSLASEQIFI